MSHYAWNCSSQIMCKVQQWKQQNSNSYNRSCTGTISCKKQCSYTYHATLSSCPTIKAPKNWNWGLNSLWTPRTLQNVAFRSSKILRWFEPNWNATLQVVYCCLSDCCLSNCCRCVYFGGDIWFASAVKSTEQIYYKPTERDNYILTSTVTCGIIKEWSWVFISEFPCN